MAKRAVPGHRSDHPELTRYAAVRVCGDLVFFAGISGRGADGVVPGSTESQWGPVLNARAQIQAAFSNLLTMLGDHDLGRDAIVDVTCYLVDMADYPVLVATWNEFFDDIVPTRTTVAVHQLPDRELRVELKAIACARSTGRRSSRASGGGGR